MTVTGKSKYVYEPVSLEKHHHTEFDAVAAFMLVMLALFLTVSFVLWIHSDQGWGNNYHMMQCVAQHAHNATVCLTKVYGGQ